MRLFIVRHGETEWSLSGRHTGFTDLPLTANGRQQASSLAPLLEQILRDQSGSVVTSPSLRATETAALALPNRPRMVDPSVVEYDYGDYEGVTTEQIREHEPEWDIWTDGCPNGEQTADVGARADTFLAAHADSGTKPVVVFTHGHFSRILAARALGLAPEYGRIFSADTASISLMDEYRDEPVIGFWNLTQSQFE